MTGLIEKEFWRPSNCFIQVKPNFRWGMVSLAASFLPFLVNKAATEYFDRFWFISYLHSFSLGTVTGTLVCSATLLSPFSAGGAYLNLGAAAIGGVSGLAYCHVIRSAVLHHRHVKQADSKFLTQAEFRL